MKIEMINGVRNSFGPRDIESKVAATVRTSGAFKHMILPVVAGKMLAHEAGDYTGSYFIPNTQFIRSFSYIAEEAFVGLAGDLTVKLVDLDGNDVVADLLTVDAATLAAGGEVTLNTPALTGVDGIVFPVIEGGDAATAGKGSLVIEFMEPNQIA